MLSKLLLGASQKLTERVLAAVTLPALGFWFVGIVALYLSPAYAAAVESIKNAGSPQLALWATTLLGAIVVSAGLVLWLAPEVSKLILGEWPNWLGGLRTWSAGRIRSAYERTRSEWQALAKKITEARWESLSAEEVRRYQELERLLHYWPSDLRQIMPTKLGNLLRAAESRPAGKYGLEPAVVWPRLELVVSRRTADLLNGMQGEFQAAAAAATWSAMLPLWVIASFAWGTSGTRLLLILGLLPASVVLFLGAYDRCVDSLERFCETFEAAFDLYRSKLYQVARFPLPATPAEELKAGRELTAYLLRGSESPKFCFAAVTGASAAVGSNREDDCDSALPERWRVEPSNTKSVVEGESEPTEDRGKDEPVNGEEGGPDHEEDEDHSEKEAESE